MREDYKLEKRTEITTDVLQVRGNEIRLDIASHTSLLVDLTKDKIIALYHKAKIVEEEKPGTVLAKIGQAIRGKEDLKLKDWKLTDKTEVINGHSCRIYGMDLDKAMKVSFWVTTDISKFEELSSAAKRAVLVLRNELIYEGEPRGLVLKQVLDWAPLSTTKETTFRFSDLGPGPLLAVPADYKPGSAM